MSRAKENQGSVLGRDPFRKEILPPPPSAPPVRAAAKRKPAAARRPPTAPPEQKDAPADVRKKIERAELLQPPAAATQQSPDCAGRGILDALDLGRQMGKAHLKFHAEQTDPFGLDPLFWQRLKPLFEFLFERYFRVEVEGTENLPSQGKVLVVANHSGTLPYDGAMLKLAIEEHHPARRAARFLVEDFVFHFPFLGTLLNRIGGVRANQDNAERLLELDQVVIVFPEGVKGIGKLYRERYRLQRFGRGGFVKLALRTGAPIVPVAILGAEEIHPLLARLEWLARPLGLPYLPITPTFPWLGPLGVIPLPSKWKIRFGKPLQLPHDPERAEQPLPVMETAEQVRSAIQTMIEEMLAARSSVFG